MKEKALKLRAGSFLFHIKIKIHGNATGVELYIGKLTEAHLQNLKITKGG